MLSQLHPSEEPQSGHLGQSFEQLQEKKTQILLVADVVVLCTLCIFCIDVSSQNNEPSNTFLASLLVISLCISSKYSRSHSGLQNENYCLRYHTPNITRYLKAFSQSLNQSLCLNCYPLL